MLYTSSEAAKLLRKLNEEKLSFENYEKQSSVFNASVNENAESVRPAYSYRDTQRKIDEINRKIRTVKHAINKFNLENEVPGFGMTIDQMLVYLPQLSAKKNKLMTMQNRLPKQREPIRFTGIIEYSYANYDVDEVRRDYSEVSDELSRAQTALDVLNNSVRFEIDI